MDILAKIIKHKAKEVEENKGLFPIKLLESSFCFNSSCVSLKKYLTRTDKSGIIAEIKRKSPSKGVINSYISVEHISIGYMQAGASALSILTDKSFFGGSNEDLKIARKFNYCPILRKDFIIDEYQIIEAKSIGADVILLIADVLDQKSILKFSSFAKSLGLEVLLEVRTKNEILNSLNQNIDIVGINNRNLRDFNVDIKISESLAEIIPDDFIKISESGINNPETINYLRQFGFKGFLIGENFMSTSRPEEACSRFIKSLTVNTSVYGNAIS